jgi:hypothetical protein
MSPPPIASDPSALQKPEEPVNIPAKDAGTDAEFIARAEDKSKETRYLEAAKLLREVQDESLLKAKHRRIMEVSDVMEQVLHNELSAYPEESEWTKQGESHSEYDFIIHYKVDKNNSLTMRIDLVVESSLLVPILSVFNESELYKTWMPSWKHPKVGLRRSDKLHEMGRGNQIIMVTVDMPFPLATREVVQHALAIDSIDDNATILIRCHSIEPGEYNNGSDETTIPEPEKGIVRIDFDCGMALRACPDDHPALKNSKKHYPEDEPKILLSIKQQIDAKILFVPLRMINFFTRHVIKQMVINLVEVASEVRSGKRTDHKEAIEQKPELYAWVEERVKVMCSNLA